MNDNPLFLSVRRHASIDTALRSTQRHDVQQKTEQQAFEKSLQRAQASSKRAESTHSQPASAPEPEPSQDIHAAHETQTTQESRKHSKAELHPSANFFQMQAFENHHFDFSEKTAVSAESKTPASQQTQTPTPISTSITPLLAPTTPEIPTTPVALQIPTQDLTPAVKTDPQAWEVHVPMDAAVGQVPGINISLAITPTLPIWTMPQTDEWHLDAPDLTETSCSDLQAHLLARGYTVRCVK